MTNNLIEVVINTIGDLDVESEYECGIRYLSLDLMANGSFVGELSFNVQGQKYCVGNFDVLLFLLDIYETLPNLIGSEDGVEHKVMFNDYVEMLHLSLEKHTLRIEIRKKDQTVFDAKCDVLIFTKRVRLLLSELIKSMYDTQPELAEYDLLNPALYSAFKPSSFKIT